MSKSFLLLFFTCIIFSLSCSTPSDSGIWFLHQYTRQGGRKFEQKTDKFWEFHQQSNRWVEVEQPFDLVSCVDGSCTKVCSIGHQRNKTEKNLEEESTPVSNSIGITERKEQVYKILPFRKRVSLIKMSDASIWITGPSGSIYERFWNGLQWVLAPHEFPVSAGQATSVFAVNQTILALAESGNLYQLQLNENSQPVWVESTPELDRTTSKEAENNFPQITSGVTSDDRERLYFCTKNRSLVELTSIEPPRWSTHGRPPGADVEAIVDALSARSEIVFTVSSVGDLYEYDQSTKPAWKKHIQKEGSAQDISLAPTKGCSFRGPNGASTVSLFLVTKGGNLVERQLLHRKWKWISHGRPKDNVLTSITCACQTELNENLNTMFLTTEAGCVFEYRIPRLTGTSQDKHVAGQWVNHNHPDHAKVAKGIAGLQLHVGRFLFPLDDGRLSELHLPGIGGEDSAPNHLVNSRRKLAIKYVWSILEAPETEGWNAEYCTEERGPSNCISGTKDENNEDLNKSSSRKRQGNNAQEVYLSLGPSQINSSKQIGPNAAENWITKNFRLRVMHEGKSFFMITDDGQIFEYLSAENVWLWLKHEHLTAIKGAVGSYNGSLFLVDENGSLLIRERTNTGLSWINCTSLRKGKQITGGPPWDPNPGKGRKATASDALYFVSKSGNLLQFTVALRKFKWKNCRNPPNTKIASIADQEMVRENIVFVIGRNGRLYQYNKVTELWHEHYQSQHLIISKFPGTAVRSPSPSLKGSLFMVLENGRLVEYHWDTVDGWHWVEHGTPGGNVTLVGSPGPCFEGGHLFLIGSDGNVYLRYLDLELWKWNNYGFPCDDGSKNDEDVIQHAERNGKVGRSTNEDHKKTYKDLAEYLPELDKTCDPKVGSTRPIRFADTSVIFELRDGRLAELKKTDNGGWVWSRTISTPTSLCLANYWAASAS
ncbi:OLC1v1005397C1 [Oldenlandia corymbosa var. corymbosa]|uniref:OLC1v1005397C1 n=1 Tax=Oldenlandia corymbosa var. corymbosa TaxID=529605 RepID=A0AAV1DFR9_OLDCO|nr:OLC1v1005397C1 [Oldenlandia corymbosa var. corymbosa]